ncbi:MAG: glycosyltransferase family 2 protein [Candidatus Poseidoniaceae archaeon]|nr:glycosyltransferase family 2 protein [Candidatus Poseidoniaceae archaeon]
MKRVMILLPTLNEEEGLAGVLPRLPRAQLAELGWEIEVLIVDGGSVDSTIQVANEHACDVLPQQGKGKGAAMRLGFLTFLRSECDALVMLDPDNTYHPEEIPKFLRHLEHADVVVGDRLRGDMDPDAMTRTNYFGNHILTWIAVALYGVPMNDLCSGYWAFTKQAIARLKLNSMRFEIEAEMYTSCAIEDLSIHHTPIRYSKRLGEAKLGSVKDGWNIFRKLLVRRIFTSPHQKRLGEGNLNIR